MNIRSLPARGRLLHAPRVYHSPDALCHCTSCPHVLHNSYLDRAPNILGSGLARIRRDTH